MCTFDGVRYEFSDKEWEELRTQIREFDRERKVRAMNAAGHDELSRLQGKV